MKKNYTEEEITILAQSAIGKTFGELQDMNVKTVKSEEYDEETEKFNKAFFGHIFENDVYKYGSNSVSAPDFEDAGIELKVTPYKRNKDNTLSAKERLVLNIINYMEEYKNDFFSSHFWYKNNKIQIIWYLYEQGINKKDLKITHEKLFTFPEEDLKIVIEDWNAIIEKIKDGKAHEISEADTMYLGACTKGANSQSLREQPFSTIKAMQRAFCLKTSYMTQLVRKYIGNYENVEKIIGKRDITFNEFINNVINKYKGMTQKQLMEEFNIESNAKNLNAMLISRMFGVKGNLSETDEFLKANIVPRTIRVEENGKIKESMPFPAFKFTDILKQEWETSDLKEELESTKYMFFVFKMVNGEYVFKGIKLWNMPQLEINLEAKHVWELTRICVLTGNIVKEIDKNGNRITNFPGMSVSKVCHVRPHARDSKDTFELPVRDRVTNATEYTKHCFWLNNKYLEEILLEFI
ncbi:dNA mismatch repair protein [Firmicutes bacterium CAG:884]|nr:dNA mismatch repair protein [Firmicutes bacterium CAG:884]